MRHRYQPCETTTAYFDVCTVQHEFDCSGSHRLQIEGKVGDWTTYAGICTIQHKDVWFAGTTEYWAMALPEIFIIHSLKKHDLHEEDPPKVKHLTLKEQLELKKAK